jgi:hypothetical protein
MRATLQRQEVKIVAVCSDSHSGIQWPTHLEPSPGLWLSTLINQWEQALLTNGVKTEILWILGHSGIAGKQELDRQANLPRQNNIRHRHRDGVQLGLQYRPTNLRWKVGSQSSVEC